MLLSICIFGAVETQRFFSDQDPLLDALGARGGTLDVGKLLPLIEKYFSSSAAYYKQVVCSFRPEARRSLTSCLQAHAENPDRVRGVSCSFTLS